MPAVDLRGTLFGRLELRTPDERGVVEDPDVAALAPGVEGPLEEVGGIARAAREGVSRCHRQLESVAPRLDESMDERQPPPTRNPSRTLAKVGVVVLLVIAIAGIVLASLQKGLPPEGPVAADATQAGSAPMTGAAASAAAAEAEGLPNHIMFAAESPRLSSAATAKLERLAEKAKADKRLLTIV